MDHNVTATLTSKGFLLGPSDHMYRPPQFAYESDGTVVQALITGTGSTRVISASQIVEVNSDYGLNLGTQYWSSGTTWEYRFLFPEPRDITHTSLFSLLYTGWWAGVDPYYRLWWSRDTNDGADGTWTQTAVTTNQWTSSYRTRRNNLDPLSGVIAVKGVKMFVDFSYGYEQGYGGYIHYIHFHGTKAQNAHRLAFWHPELDEEVDMGHFDWGNFDPGTAEKYFRIKNLSPYWRATGATLSQEGATHAFKVGAGTFQPSLTFGMLNSFATTPVITVRKVISPTTLSGPMTGKLTAFPTGWQPWVHNVEAPLVVSFAVVSTSTRSTYNPTVTLTAGSALTNALPYRNPGTYQNSKPYTASGFQMAWGSTVALTAALKSDVYDLAYVDAYGSAGLVAEAYNSTHRTTAALSAALTGDNYPAAYTTAYGNTALHAIATVT